MWVGDCSDTKHLEPEPSAAESVVEDKSPDGLLIARVVAAGEPGHYMFLVEEIASGKTIAHSSLSAPVGYHSQMVQIRWENIPSRQSLTMILAMEIWNSFLSCRQATPDKSFEYAPSRPGVDVRCSIQMLAV